MKTKREIHALDYAIVEFVAALERLFLGYIAGWVKIVRGLNVELEREAQADQYRAWVHCPNWLISVQFRNGRWGWEAFKGSASYIGLPPGFVALNGPVPSFNFTCELTENGDYVFHDSSEWCYYRLSMLREKATPRTGS